MSGLASLALKRAVFAHLSADSMLMARISGIHDAPPNALSFPYLVMSGISAEDWSSKTFIGQRHRLILRLFSDSPGETELLDLADMLVARLQDAPLTLEGHGLLSLRFDSLITLRDQDDIRQAQLRFLALTQAL